MEEAGKDRGNRRDTIFVKKDRPACELGAPKSHEESAKKKFVFNLMTPEWKDRKSSIFSAEGSGRVSVFEVGFPIFFESALDAPSAPSAPRQLPLIMRYVAL